MYKNSYGVKKSLLIKAHGLAIDTEFKGFQILDKGDEVSLVSRPAAAAPAVGLMKLHLQQQEELVKEAMGK